jgi:hypothetical protein
MGSKRIGLARFEALLENLKREINLNSSIASNAGAAGAQGSTKLIVGKNAAGGATADPFAESSTQLFDFGTLLFYGDRVFRYAGIGGVAVTAGKTLQAAALYNANHRDMAVQAAAAAGATSVAVTFGGDTDAAANLYAEGYLHINDVAGQGQLLRIKSHDAVDASASTTCTLVLYDKVVTALTTSSKADLITATYNDLVVGPTTFTGPIIGITAMDMTANYYGWVQIAGPCSVLLDVNPTGATEELGGLVIRSDDNAGACMGIGVVTGDADLAHQVIGTLMVNNGDTDNVVVWLSID